MSITKNVKKTKKMSIITNRAVVAKLLKGKESQRTVHAVVIDE